ncbi:MAG: hypothetical protein WC530_07935 [Candidatus Omnitrophota bacterium]|jgi:hypothetical protein
MGLSEAEEAVHTETANSNEGKSTKGGRRPGAGRKPNPVTENKAATPGGGDAKSNPQPGKIKTFTSPIAEAEKTDRLLDDVGRENIIEALTAFMSLINSIVLSLLKKQNFTSDQDKKSGQFLFPVVRQFAPYWMKYLPMILFVGGWGSLIVKQPALPPEKKPGTGIEYIPPGENGGR